MRLPTVILLTVVAAVLIVLSELASNTAVAAAFLPVMGAVAVSAAIHPDRHGRYLLLHAPRCNALEFSCVCDW